MPGPGVGGWPGPGLNGNSNTVWRPGPGFRGILTHFLTPSMGAGRQVATPGRFMAGIQVTAGPGGRGWRRYPPVSPRAGAGGSRRPTRPRPRLGEQLRPPARWWGPGQLSPVTDMWVLLCPRTAQPGVGRLPQKTGRQGKGQDNEGSSERGGTGHLDRGRRHGLLPPQLGRWRRVGGEFARYQPPGPGGRGEAEDLHRERRPAQLGRAALHYHLRSARRGQPHREGEGAEVPGERLLLTRFRAHARGPAGHLDHRGGLPGGQVNISPVPGRRGSRRRPRRIRHALQVQVKLGG
jgi:hypothetical protein